MMAQGEFGVSNDPEINNPNRFSEQPPPPPMVASEGIIATDITSKFTAATGALKPGELVKDAFFTLFEAVGALEIMDPKMDSGCLAPGESLDEDYDVTRPLQPAQVVGIIDQLLCLEMAWHLGYPLSQTLLTNVYIEAMLMPAPTNLREADFIRNHAEGARPDPMFTVLRAYCLGLLKSCWYVTERIKREHYYEEEDFVTNTYHRSLLDNIDRNEISNEIMAARKIIHQMRHALTDKMAWALDFRLGLRTAFLRTIELSELRSNPDSLSLPWHHMQGVWEQIHNSRQLGTPVPEAFSPKIQRKLASTMPPRPIVQLSFEETSDHFRKLIKDGIEVHEVFKYSDPQSLLNFVLTFQAQKPQPLVYIRTLLQFYLFRDMVILDNLSIRKIIDDDLAIVSMPKHRLLDPVNDVVEAPHDARFAMAHQMELFRQRATQSYLDIFRAFCQNRCRVRRTLCHSIQDWETVQMDAEELDQLLQIQLDEKPINFETGSEGVSSPEAAYSLPLSSWAYLYKLRLMEWIVQLGFELETYQPIEMAGMYWYLAYLAKIRTSHLGRIRSFITHRSNELEPKSSTTRARPSPSGPSFSSSGSPSSSNGGRSDTTASFSSEPQFVRSFAYHRVSTLEAAVTWELADGLSALYTALYRLRLIVPPPRPYSSDSLRYDIRMKPFAPIGLPELPSFETFTEQVTRPRKSIGNLLEIAREAIAGAKMGFEALSKYNENEAFAVGCLGRWTEGAKNGIKSAIAAGLAVAAVKNGIAAAAATAPDEEEEDLDLGNFLQVEVPKPEKAYHKWWIVPKVHVGEKKKT
ncbi:N-alpha-acetyltransferase 35, NatC auxiliary subunit [Rhypophila decipiens]|uniref:N-alpha-acetyltransferase 35, NatC auxiliary subunit n=1 Tax=Rhypophila decipiens TaxID=261697 RepID=A0AAN6Y9N5_9PEZI|nr:N-alpha-acetyltransferase 35, NatC auxiliary subunit [Rhypophila decipiens]